jgi:hypothetical protein
MRNNSFRKTFYLGLFFLLILCGTVTIVGVNVYKAVSSNIKKTTNENLIIHENLEDSVVSTPFSSGKPITDTAKIIKDTIKPIVKPKPVITVKKDTIVKSDTIL